MSSLTKIPAGVQYFFDDEVHLRRSVKMNSEEAERGYRAASGKIQKNGVRV